MNDNKYAYKIGNKYLVCFAFDSEELANEMGELISLLVSLIKEERQ